MANGTDYLILGDTGLLGQALVRHATRLQLRFRGASRSSADWPLDAEDAGTLAHVFETLRPHTVINAAGLVDLKLCEQHPERAWLANARLPGLLASLSSRHGCRLIQLSTDHFFTGDGAAAHDETAPVTLVNEYARSKYAGECLALTHADTLVVRTNIVGFRGWAGQPTFAEWLADALVRGLPISLFDDFFTSSLTASQCADALFRLLETPCRGRLNLAARQGASKAAFAEAFADALGVSTAACTRASIRTLGGAPRAESLTLDVAAAEARLGVPLPDLAAVVRQLAAEYRQQQETP